MLLFLWNVNWSNSILYRLAPAKKCQESIPCHQSLPLSEELAGEQRSQRLLIWSDQLKNCNSIKWFCWYHKLWEQGSVRFRDHQSPVTELIQTLRSMKLSLPYLLLTYPLAVCFSISPVCPLLLHPCVLSAFNFPCRLSLLFYHLPSAPASCFAPHSWAQPDVRDKVGRCFVVKWRGLFSMSILAECIFFPFWDIKNSCRGSGIQIRIFPFKKVLDSVCVFLCYFIRIIKGISVQVMGS